MRTACPACDSPQLPPAAESAGCNSLVRTIAATVGRPVVDQTGLLGYYAVSFRFMRFPLPAGGSSSLDDPPSVFTALQEQLGLKLEPATTAGQMLVIDHIERPTEN